MMKFTTYGISLFALEGTSRGFYVDKILLDGGANTRDFACRPIFDRKGMLIECDAHLSKSSTERATRTLIIFFVFQFLYGVGIRRVVTMVTSSFDFFACTG